VNVLVDTSIWSLALRRKAQQLNANEQALVTELLELIKEGRAAILGIIRQELLSGIKALEQYDKLRLRLRAFPDVALEISDYETAAKHSNACRSRGIAVYVVDALICAIAAGRSWPVFTTDPDFASYARVLPIQLHRPRG
jgi:predicted nucleic acid-binding protein